MEKAYRVLTKLFYIFALLFPYLIGILFALFNLLIGWDRLGIPGRDHWYYCMDEIAHPIISVYIVVIALLLIIKFCNKRKIEGNKKGSEISILVFLLTLFIRLFLIILFKDSVQPFSDEGAAWENAKGNLFLTGHYAFFPSYLHYAIYERIITHFSRKYYIVLLSNAFLAGLTSVGICNLSKRIYGEWRPALFASLIYSLYPPSIIYSLLGSPTHIAIALNVLGFLFVIALVSKIVGGQAIKFKLVVEFFAVGLVFGISDSMKSFFPIYVIASAIVLFLYFIKEGHKNRYFLVIILMFCVMLFGERLSCYAITGFTEHVFGIEEHGDDAFPHFVLVGLSREEEGQIGKTGLSRTFINMRDNGVEQEEAKEYAYGVLKDDWAGHIDEVPMFLLKKVIWAWQGDGTPNWYFNYSMEIVPQNLIGEKVFCFLKEYGPSLSHTSYLSIMILAFLSVVFELKRGLEHGIKMTYVNLCVFGFAALLLLIEAQSNYKSLVFPFICISAANSYNVLLKKGKQ